MMSARSQHEFTRTGLFDNSTVYKTVSTIGVLNSIRAVPRVHTEFNLLQLTGCVGVCPKGTPSVLCLPSLALKLPAAFIELKTFTLDWYLD